MAKENNGVDEFESVYNNEGREELVEDDEISPEEEAFMAGYEDGCTTPDWQRDDEKEWLKYIASKDLND